MNQIHPIGSKITIDKDGNLVHNPDFSCIQKHWRALLDKLGQVIDGVSDIDTFAIVREGDQEIQPQWIQDDLNELLKLHSFATGIETIIM